MNTNQRPHINQTLETIMKHRGEVSNLNANQLKDIEDALDLLQELQADESLTLSQRNRIDLVGIKILKVKYNLDFNKQ